ncbi:MAG: hypothetical protein OEV30_05175 [Ignavibacteria bacterium]|nr:hypothetical protein [Ignavibacteria bacterium]
MAASREPHKVDRVRVTFVPTDDEQGFRNIPSTFSLSSRTYGWKKTSQMEYLIVPKKVSSDQVVVEMFVETKKGKTTSAQVEKAVEEFVSAHVESDWHGLKVARIGKVTSALPPDRRFVRGTIEEIMGSRLDRD